MVYSQDSLAEVNKAVAAFNAANKDPKAQLLLSSICMAGKMLASVSFVYDGPKPPKGMFDDIIAIPAMVNQTFTTTWMGLVKAFKYEPRFGPQS